MKRIKRILLGGGCVLLLAISWFVALTAKTDGQRQSELMEQAAYYMKDEAYVMAVPLLEEAAGYEDANTLAAEEMLKEAYLKLLNTSGYSRKYANLLNKQMARENASSEVFIEAIQYYMSISKNSEVFSILRSGIAKTGDAELLRMYEDLRYEYKIGRGSYEEVTAIYGGTIQVMRNGLWGIATSNGSLVIPCEYNKISTYSGGEAVVLKDNTVYAVDRNNNRVALYHGTASDIGNLAESRIGLKTENGWLLANSSLRTAPMVLEQIGMCTNGYLPAEQNGKWGLLSATEIEWAIEPSYDSIICDELGRCYAQGALFLRKGEQVYLMANGKWIEDTYDDAKPFADGWAAVKKDGKWGFIDTTGTVRINYQFDDALSFGQHLAAVRVGDYWGYISLYGEIVIEPVFLSAKSFSGGCAPVQTEKGWQFITLVEYE